MVVLVDHRQFLDFMFLQDVGGLLKRHLGGGDEVLARHHLGDGTVEATLEAQVAVGDDADEHVVAVDDGDAADAVFRHQVEGVFHRSVDMDGHRVADHAVLGAFHLAHLGGLFADGHVLVQHADAAFLCDGDGHAALRHGVHAGGDHGDVEVDMARELGLEARLAREYVTIGRDQEDIVVGQAFTDDFFVI